MGALQAQSPLLRGGEGGGRGIKAVVGVPSTTADSYLTVSLEERGRRAEERCSVLRSVSRCCAPSVFYKGCQSGGKPS